MVTQGHPFLINSQAAFLPKTQCHPTLSFLYFDAIATAQAQGSHLLSKHLLGDFERSERWQNTSPSTPGSKAGALICRSHVKLRDFLRKITWCQLIPKRCRKASYIVTLKKCLFIIMNAFDCWPRGRTSVMVSIIKQNCSWAETRLRCCN